MCQKAMKPLSEIIHEYGGQREIDGDARDVVRRRDERSGRNGRINAHPFEYNRHKCGHAGGDEEGGDQRHSDHDPEKALMPDPSN